MDRWAGWPSQSTFDGEHTQAMEWLRSVHKLTINPLPLVAQYEPLIAFQEERFRDANPGLLPFAGSARQMMYLIACYGHLGERDKAQAIAERFAAGRRVFDFIAAAAREPYRDPELRQSLIAGLKLALP